MPQWAFSKDGLYLTGGLHGYHYAQTNPKSDLETDQLPMMPAASNAINPPWFLKGKSGYGGAGYAISDDFTIGFDYAWGYQYHTQQIETKVPVTPHSEQTNSSRRSSLSTSNVIFDHWASPKQGNPQQSIDNISQPTGKQRRSTLITSTQHYTSCQTIRSPNLHFKWTLLQLHPRFKFYGIGTLGLLNQMLTLEENEQEVSNETQRDIILAVGAGIQWKLLSSLSVDMNYTSILYKYTLSHPRDILATPENCDLWRIGLQFHL